MSNNRKKLPSTKNLEGSRVGGVLYLDRGVGSGKFQNINCSGSSTGFSSLDSFISKVNKNEQKDHE